MKPKDIRHDLRRPMARVTQIPLVVREVRERINPAALEILLAGARKLSEGQISDLPDGSQRYFGSTMLTLDLANPGPYLRPGLDASDADKLAKAIRTQPSLAEAVRRLAIREAHRLAGVQLRNVEVEIRVAVRDCRVLLDLDVEADAPGQEGQVRGDAAP